MAQKHRMVIESETAEGVKWVCPVCGRSILFSSGKMKTLNHGDFHAQHSGMASRKHPEQGATEISMDVKIQLPDPDAPALC